MKSKLSKGIAFALTTMLFISCGKDDDYQAVAENNTEAGRAQNRRTELKVISK